MHAGQMGGAVMKYSVPTLKQVQAHLHEHSLQMASLRAALDIQLTRIAQMQAELDTLPQARKRRRLLRVLLTRQSVGHQTRA
jgi:hypothetical protein